MTDDRANIEDLQTWLVEADPRRLEGVPPSFLPPGVFDILELAIECHYLEETSVLESLRDVVDELFQRKVPSGSRERPLLDSLLRRFGHGDQLLESPHPSQEATMEFAYFTAAYDAWLAEINGPENLALPDLMTDDNWWLYLQNQSRDNQSDYARVRKGLRKITWLLWFVDDAFDGLDSRLCSRFALSVLEPLSELSSFENSAKARLGAAWSASMQLTNLFERNLPSDNTQPLDNLAQSAFETLHRVLSSLDTNGLLAAYRRGLAIAEALVARDPANSGWQRDVSVSQIKIGDVLMARGDGPAALDAYRQGLAIAEALVARDSANTGRQRDLSISHDRIGDLLMAQGDGPGALAEYRHSLAIRKALTARDPANTEWQRDLSVSHNKIGDVLLTQGDGPKALAAYRYSLAIRQALTARDPANSEWQRDLSASESRIGDVHATRGNGARAKASFRRGLAIAEALVARDPSNTEWQRDLSVSHTKIGDVLMAQGDWPDALAEYRQGFAIAEALVARDPANTWWQRDLSVSHTKIGDVLMAQGDWPDALAEYRPGFAIATALAARDPTNTEWQRDLSVSYDRIGDLLVAQGDVSEALAEYGKGLAIAEVLTARDPANALWKRDLSVSRQRISVMLEAQRDAPGALAEDRGSDRGRVARELRRAWAFFIEGTVAPADGPTLRIGKGRPLYCDPEAAVGEGIGDAIRTLFALAAILVFGVLLSWSTQTPPNVQLNPMPVARR